MQQSPSPTFDQVVIVGVGLLGASLGLALKARGIVTEIIGVGRRETSLEKARAKGAIDQYALDLAEAAATADLIVIATPAEAVIPALDTLRLACKPSAVVTDVASTKGAICEHARLTWPAPRRFVGSHPMAGSEQFGPDHGRPDFYEGSVCLVEKNSQVDPAASELVKSLWESVGARVVEIDPRQHDAVLARTSHLPHITAAGLAVCASRQEDIQALVGNGFRDSTRIAAGNPEIWRDICLTNRTAILESLGEMQAWLREFEEALVAGDPALLEALFELGRRARRDAVPE